MDSAREYRKYLEQQQQRPVGVAGDLKRLKSDSGASAAELREFLGKLKGRSPEEVMGVVANSDLVRSTLMATVGCFVLLVVLTVVPYAIKLGSPGLNEKPAAAVATDEAPAAVAETAADTSAQPAAVSLEPDLERAAEVLGIGGTTEADPNSNPLDSKLDKLLDGIE